MSQNRKHGCDWGDKTLKSLWAQQRGGWGSHRIQLWICFGRRIQSKSSSSNYYLCPEDHTFSWLCFLILCISSFVNTKKTSCNGSNNSSDKNKQPKTNQQRNNIFPLLLLQSQYTTVQSDNIFIFSSSQFLLPLNNNREGNRISNFSNFSL